MVNCAVPSCKNDSRRQTKVNSNVTFHRFPRNEETLKRWVDALQRPDWEPTIRSFVCSAHFPETSMYFSKSGLRKLTPDAVPLLLLHNFELQKGKKKKTKKSKITIFTDKKIKDYIKTEPGRKTDMDTDVLKLKKRIVNLTKLSKRRRLRCNALYASLNRIRKKVTNIVGSLKGLQMKVEENEELGRVLERYGVDAQDLLQGLGNKERSVTPELQEEEYFYAEIASDYEDQPAPPRVISVLTTSYPPCPPALSPLPPAEVTVKTELEPGSPGPEPVSIQISFTITVDDLCQHLQPRCSWTLAPRVPSRLRNTENGAPLGPDHKDFYETLANIMVINK